MTTIITRQELAETLRNLIALAQEGLLARDGSMDPEDVQAMPQLRQDLARAEALLATLEA